MRSSGFVAAKALGRAVTKLKQLREAPTANLSWKTLESSLCLIIEFILVDDSLR